MSTPRQTRLIRVSTLARARRFVLDAARGPLETVRRTAIILPSRGAAEQVRRGIEATLTRGHAAVVPLLLTRDGWLSWLFRHISDAPPVLSPYEREALLGAAARHAATSGFAPPFRLRVALVGGMLDFYDTLRRQSGTIDDFERLAAGRFERDADEDLGAARLLAQARFMVSAFREYERRLAAAGRSDEHTLRLRLLDLADTPLRRVVVTVGDRAADPHGLWSVDFDTLTRLNGLEAIDVVATDAALRAGLLNRLREWLPGLEESADDAGAPETPPVLVVPAGDDDALVFRHRDREDELAWVTRRIVASAHADTRPRADRVAVVYKRPLPYVYLAGRLFAGAGVPWDATDALPLASDPAACGSRPAGRCCVVPVLAQGPGGAVALSASLARQAGPGASPGRGRERARSRAQRSPVPGRRCPAHRVDRHVARRSPRRVRLPLARNVLSARPTGDPPCSSGWPWWFDGCSSGSRR